MARRLKGSNVTVNSSHPGVVATEISRGFNDSTFWSSVFPAMVRFTGVYLIHVIKYELIVKNCVLLSFYSHQSDYSWEVYILQSGVFAG